MKRVLTTVILVCILVQSAAYSQGFFTRLTQPDEVGGNVVATHKDALGESTSFGPGIELFIKYDINPKLFVTTGIGFLSAYDKSMTWDQNKYSMLPSFELKAGYQVLESKFTPMVFAGIQAYNFKKTINKVDNPSYFDASIFGGGGVRIQASEKLAINLTGDYRYVFTDTDDPKGKFWTAKAGISYALNRRPRQSGREEMEYPINDNDLALDELFRDTTPATSNDDQLREEDALALLFQTDDMDGYDAFEESSGSSMNDVPDDLFATPETANEEVGQLYDRIRSMKTEMEQRLQQIANLQSQVRSNERAIAEMSGRMAGEYTSESFGVVSSESFKTSYEVGLQKFYDRKYNEAIRIFKGLLTTNPDHRLASNCQYWIGESYNAQGNYQEAIAAFQRVMNFKKSFKYDDALLMSGLVYMKLGDQATARDNFQQLVSKYPDSEYAPKAMRYLGRF